MGQFSVLYGQEKEFFELPEGIKVEHINAKPSQAMADVKAEIRERLANPIGSAPFRDIFKKGEKVVIIVSDYTRASYKFYEFVPIILDELNAIGIPDGDISIVMSTGDHRNQTVEEHKMVVGEEVLKRVKIYDHECHAEDLVDLGQTTRGTTVQVNRKVYEADRVILTGGIVYHLLAGFGGGRKSVAPGVCGYRTIQENHSLALNPEPGQTIGAGVLEENPVAQDMDEICQMVNPDFLLNVVLNEKKEFVGVVAGHWHKAFLAGTELVEKAFGIPIKEQADMVIASAGGFPKDIQLYQTIKTLDNASYAVKNNGDIILVSQCSDGPGPDSFLSWFQYENYEEMSKALNANFTMPGFVALRTAEIIRDKNVYLVSDLAKEVVTKVGMRPVTSVEEAIQFIAQNKKITSAHIMPYGSLTFPLI